MRRISSSISNASIIEEELNTLANNWYIPKDKAQLFAKINDTNYYPIPTYVDSEGNIVIDDIQQARNRDLFIGTKNQFLYKRFDITYSSNSLILGKEFSTGWNPKHYTVFRNGYLLSPSLYEVICPTLTTSYTDKCIFSRTNFLVNDYIDVFYIEHAWNFKEVKFNQDVYIKCVKVMATEPNQYVYKIPYPYHSYPKGDNMFYVFSNNSKRFLVKNGLDYTLDSTATHIYIQNNAAYIDRDLKIQTQPVSTGGYVDRPEDGEREISFTFVFPYCTSEYELNNDAGVGETSDLSLIYLKAVSKSGMHITFESFSEFELNKDNFLLLYNDEVLDTNTYELASNNIVKLYDTNPYKNESYNNFKMVLYIERDDFTDFKPNKLLQYDMFMVIPTKI